MTPLAIPAGIVNALAPQQQPAQQPFVWGSGGRRLTPEDIAREREMAADSMRPNFSPVGSTWEGLGRVAQNLIGGWDMRNADKAARENQAYSQNQIAQLLTGGGLPSASAPPGSPQSSGSGGNLALAQQIIADPYADQGAKAIATMQLKQAQAMAMKQFEYDNRPQPEIVQLSNIANDPTQPAWRRKDAKDRIDAINNPVQVVPGLVDGQPFVGRLSDIPAFLGGQGGGATNTGDVIDDPRKQGGQPATPAGTF